jgi:hypothetical protein
MDNLLNWGFSPIGSPLGSEGALSMPTEEATGLENPLTTTENMLSSFTEQTARRYGNVSDVGGSVWDPRGDRALSKEVADYRTSDFMRPDEIPLSIADMSPELMGGDPILAPFAASNQLDPAALHSAGLGLSDAGAATLADSLSVVDPAVLDGIYIPPQVEPQIVNEIGMVTSHGGLPDAFFEPGAGVLRQGLPESVDNVIRGQGQYQYVDDNGVVDKYSEGTGPYDAPGMTRPGSLLGALPGTRIRTKAGVKYGGHHQIMTPASIASNPRFAMRMAGGVPGTPPGFDGQNAGGGTPNATHGQTQRVNAGSSLSSQTNNQMNNANQGGGSSTDAVTNATSSSAGQQQTGTGSNAPQGLPVFETDSVAGQSAAQETVPTSGKWCPSWWKIAVGVGIAAVGTVLLVRKGKKGRK